MDDIVAIDKTVAGMMVLNSLAFHLQSVTAYVLMADISPVSHRFEKQKLVVIRLTRYIIV